MTRDVVIVGGGIAGLAGGVAAAPPRRAAARGRRPPGRAHAVGPAAARTGCNYGAHLFPAPGSLVDSMARDCGLETAPVTGGMMGLAVGSTRLTTAAASRRYPFRLPLSAARPGRVRPGRR